MEHTADTSARHRGLVVALVGALVACGLGVVLTSSLSSLDLADACGPDGDVMRMPDGSRTCVHSDEAPPGVDVTEPVSTAELKRRVGAGPKAYAAAETLGVPTAVASNATTPDVTCEGDGESGFRTQAMYVVESGKANRFASLLSTFRIWAAGVDDVVNRSAALTGGVRHVRYVTEPGSTPGTCVADVLNVTVPAGAMSSFNATIQAVQAQGYHDPNRKYLMWTDATSLCGIATMYNTDGSGQDNANNGSYAQYSRVDSGCWGHGNGTSQHSVEAHELVHNLGGVQNSAPHTTRAGHCYDEADTMCYNDGGGRAMQSICTAEREYLLDCNSDDYFTTFADPGSYLDTRWNTASSRFLIGGGAGGTVGTPTVLGARLAVNNPAVPGLSTQATVTPVLPTGRTLASVAWKSARADCVFATPNEVQSLVTCNAAATSATTVTATIVDSTGATKVVTSPLTFATGTARSVTPVLTVAGQRSDEVSSASMCISAATPVSAVLTDTATGEPIKGLTTAFTKQTAAQTTAAAAGAPLTDAAGAATISATSATAITFGISNKASTVYAAATPVRLPATVAKCSPELAATASTQDIYHGDAVTVSGTLTRDVAGEDVGVGAASLPVTVTTTATLNGRTTTKSVIAGTAKTAADGSFSLVVKPTTSGRMRIALAASSSYNATSVDLGDLDVTVPGSTMTAEVDTTDVGYGDPVVVTGTLERMADTTAGAPGLTVSVKLAVPGKAPAVVGTGKTAADGTFRVVAPLKASGFLSVTYAGAAGLPAAIEGLGDITVGTWDTTLEAAPSATTAAVSQPVSITGTLTKSYGGADLPAKGVVVKLYSRATGATRDTVASVSVPASGVFTFTVRPKLTTTYSVKVLGVPGHTDATEGPFTITVS